MIIDKNNEYWGALTKINNSIESIQILNNFNPGIHEIFKSKRNVTFITNADTIMIDGIGEVETEITLWEGEYVVTFTKTNFQSETIILIVEDDTIVEKYLNPSYGQLNINSDPVGAYVYVNSDRVGVTPLTLEHFRFGSYFISFAKTNYQTETFYLNFNVDGQNVLKTLTPIPEQTPEENPEENPEPIPEPDLPIDVPAVKPAPSTPSISISNITQNSAKITFSASNTTSYDIYVNNVFKANTKSTTYQLSSLSSSTTYSIKIIAKGNGTAQNTKSFTTLAPVIPTPTAPLIYNKSASFMSSTNLNYGLTIIKFKSTSSSHNYFRIDVDLLDKNDSNGIAIYSHSELNTSAGANKEGWIAIKCHIPNYPSWVKFKVKVRSYYNSSKYSTLAERSFRVKIVNSRPDYVQIVTL
jgi:chitodextrinase